MWFCIRNKLLQDQLVSQGSIPLELPLRRTNEVPKKVRKCFIEVTSKGEKKVKDKLKEKLHESFPLFRLTSLESVLEQEEDIEELSDGL
jgi:polyhydroxyalkanoate synthesis regulator phasin